MKYKLQIPIIAILAMSVWFLLPQGNASAHCDAIDGPVVTAAKKALETGDVKHVLPYVARDGEAEVREAFADAMKVRNEDEHVRHVVDYWFYETAVRVHRTGEGESYTGLKPAGVDYGPALPAAEEALETGSTEELKQLLLKKAEAEIDKRFASVTNLPYSLENVQQTRERVESELSFQKYIHQIYSDATAIVDHEKEGHAATEGNEHVANEEQHPEEEQTGFMSRLRAWFARLMR